MCEGPTHSLVAPAGPSRPLVSQFPPPRTPSPNSGGWHLNHLLLPETNRHFRRQLGKCCMETPATPTPQPARQPSPTMGIPPWGSSRQRWPVNLPDNTYRDEAPVNIFGHMDNTSVLRRNVSLVLHTMSTLIANILWEGGAKLINYLLSATVQPLDRAGGKLPNVQDVCEWHY